MIRLTIITITYLLLHSCQPGSGREASGQKPVNTNINQSKKINCFIYHRFGDPRYPSTNISVEHFDTHLKYLKEAGFDVMNFSEAIQYLQDTTPERKVAVITIDDAFKSFYENGLPLLEKYDFPATLFVNTSTVGGGSYMDWSELKEAVLRGIEIGNHTHSHGYFLNFKPESRYDEFESEIRRCQELIVENLGIKPKVFAFPYGEFDKKMMNIVKAAGFLAAAAQNSGVIDYTTDLMACPRFPMATGFDDIEGFKLKANANSFNLQGSPENHLVETSKPGMSLKLVDRQFRLDEMQCFIQGNNCSLTKKQLTDTTFQIEIKPENSIAGRRRTLYTLTIQDQQNQWYWYSFLWINPAVKE